MIRGKTRALDTAENHNIEQSFSIHNRFDIEVVDATTGRVKEKAQAFNTICDQLYTYMLAPAAYANYIHYGSGSGTPSASDTALFNYEGGIALEYQGSDAVYGYDFHTGVHSCTRKAQIPPEVAVGVEISEIGIAYGSASNTLCTHAMLQDMNGNSISIAKTDTDLINVYATIFIHTQQSEEDPYVWFPKKVTTGNNKTDQIYESKSVTNFMWWLFGVYYLDSGFYTIKNLNCIMQPGVNPGVLNENDSAQNMVSGQFSITFDKENHRAVFPVPRFSVGVGNLDSGAMAVSFMTYGASEGPCFLAFILDSRGSWFPGSTITGESIGTGDGVTTDFATKYSLPENATVYVDGVPVSATVDNVPLMYNDMGAYFILIEDGNPATQGTYDYGIVTVSRNGISASGPKRVGYTTWLNPFYQYGIASFSLGTGVDYITVEVSDDLKNWETVPLTNTTTQVPEALRYKKYWRVSCWGTNYSYRQVYDMVAADLTGKNIHFAAPPAEGAVITADYTTKVIAKDDQHVFDLTVTMNFKEYTE